MAKKITVKILKSSETMSIEELAEIYESLVKRVRNEDIKSLDNLSIESLTLEEDTVLIMGIGHIALALLKKACTPAAWNIIVDELREMFKD